MRRPDQTRKWFEWLPAAVEHAAQRWNLTVSLPFEAEPRDDWADGLTAIARGLSP